jgi:cytoskeleton protein RodZ
MNDETPDSRLPAGAFPQAGSSMDAANHQGGADASPPPRFDPHTAGGMIRSAREEQGMDLGSMAAMLKVPLHRLESLEGGRHAEMQGPTFERALAQAACRLLKLDPKPVLALLPRHEGNTLERVTEGINTPFRDGQASRGFELPGLVRPWVVIVVLLVLAALALFAVPESWIERVTHPFTASPAASAPVDAAASGAATGNAGAPVDLPPAGAVASAPVAVSPAAASAPLPPAAASAPASAAPAGALTPAAVSATAAQGIDEVLAHAAGAPSIPLQVNAVADSWVEVVDAKGRSLLSRTVVAGESVGLDGALPMRVKIGNASGTRLKLRGDNVDLAPWTHDNIARLEVK